MTFRLRATRLLVPLCCALTLPRATSAQDALAVRDTTWTLQSGHVVYRLVTRDGALGLDYFGPASIDTVRRDTATRPPRADIAGLANGRALAPSTLRVVSTERRSPMPGVEELRIVLRHATLPLEIEARYGAWGETGVITRELHLANRGTTPIRIESSPSLSLDLPAGEYSLRYLYGGWGQERQLAVEPVGAGARRFDQTRGRSAHGYIPWLSLRNERSGIEYIAELAWSGNWSMEIERHPGAAAARLRDQPLAVRMEMRHDFGGSLALAPGDEFALPRVALTASTGTLDDAANQMHRWQRAHVMPRSATNTPLLVQFNSWYPYGAAVTAENMMRAADAAAALGAEVYIMDSGWYTSGDWTRTLGDYQANRQAFPNGIEELAAHVRRLGMKFGLWVEIENVGLQSRIYREHPDWCLPYLGKPAIAWDRCQLDFAKPEVRRWARATIDRLVRDNGLQWLKIDYNIDVGERFDPAGPDRAGRRLHDHIVAFYEFLDELRAAYPALVIENCSSGGLRFDTGIMAHAHTTWVSDNVDPVASLQLGWGCTLQFPAELCNHWMVGDRDNGEVDQSKPAGWWDYLFRVPMTGQFGISSRITEWGEPLRQRAVENIALYKRIRSTIAGADVYHLTPAPGLERPRGWMGIQYVAPGGGRSVVLAYRLAGGARDTTLLLRGLDPAREYDVALDGRTVRRMPGRALAAEGLSVSLDEEWRAAVIELAARPDPNSAQWEQDIRAFEEADHRAMPSPGGVLFVGSSSIRLWESLARDFPGVTTINRGFGGSQLPDAVHYMDRIVLPYAPRTIVLYAGDNDLWAGATPEQLLEDYERFVSRVHERLPETRILYLAVKPSTARWSIADRIRKANALIRARAARDPRLGFVDVFTPMLGPDGRPRPELLVEDGLHMTPAGYAVWRDALAPFLR